MTTIGEQDLDRRLLAGIERLGRALRAGRQRIATAHDLSVLGLAVLERLHEQGPQRPGDLAEELDVSQPTGSDAVGALQRRGLVERRRNPADLRSSLVHLTDAGGQVAAEVARELAPLLRVDAATAADRGTALRVVLGQIARLQRDGVITVARTCFTCGHFDPGDGAGARCLLLRRDLPDTDLRVDCAEHVPAPAV
ncbi:MAG: MarR family winged helix-turn-helix transcriptional regulator [Microbacterium sp.]